MKTIEELKKLYTKVQKETPGAPLDPTQYPNWKGWHDLFGITK